MSRTSSKPLRITFALLGLSIEVSIQAPCPADREDPADSACAQRSRPCVARGQG